ncbi:MAG: hypothetical protein JXB18_11590 [Sedimentisphaerales bacterium]|nr:hypothetical protein [Sedimentisphaerales bacterium]
MKLILELAISLNKDDMGQVILNKCYEYDSMPCAITKDVEIDDPAWGTPLKIDIVTFDPVGNILIVYLETQDMDTESARQKITEKCLLNGWLERDMFRGINR